MSETDRCREENDGSMCRYIDVVFNAPMKETYTYLLPEAMECSVGQRVSVTLGKRLMVGYPVHVSTGNPDPKLRCKPIVRVIDKDPVFGSDDLDTARWIASFYLCSLGEALSAMIPGGKRDTSLPTFGEMEDLLAQPTKLSDEQKLAISELGSRLSRSTRPISARNHGLAEPGEHSPADNAPAGTDSHDSGQDKAQLYYLFGVTGSGKTEVFLQAARQSISLGRPVIYLVPEITLTHQLSEQMKQRFGGRVAILHSALTPSQRLNEWLRIRRGEVDIAIGARSAIFAPFRCLGLIIIDEEHEGSYKSGSTPRYHARQVAMYRCRKEGAVLVMGSATPSMEAWHMMQSGRMKRLDLPYRVSGGSMPAVETVDMCGEDSPLSRRLQSEIQRVLDNGRQVILFLNRRGFTYFFHCRTCGYEMSCDHCSVALTYHRERERMVCHYCGRTRRPVSVCPECGSLDVGYSGFGTEMIEDEVRRLFPRARTVRLDADAAKKKAMVRTTLEAFRKQEIDILLGTQMVAKGLNFPGVDLVGIVLADSALHLPDFRALERTFSLILQVSGRTGRYSDAGKVIVQTYRPENSAVRLAARGAVGEFCQEELEVRRTAGFPPFVRILLLVFRGRNSQRVADEARKAAHILAELSDSERERDGSRVEILGPAESPVARISGNWRWQILLRSASLTRLHRTAVRFVSGYKVPSGLYLEVDVDPVSLL